MNSIGHFFKTIDSFLSACVEYIEKRVLTGKFIIDITYLIGKTMRNVYKPVHRIFFTVIRSKPSLLLRTILTAVSQELVKIPLFATIFSLLKDAFIILIICYSELFIVFAITFTSSILLLDFFQTSILTFVILLIPFLLLDILCTEALYYCIDSRMRGEHVSIWQSFIAVFRHFLSFSFPVITQIAIILEMFVTFSIISLFINYIFGIFQIPWDGSFFYWFFFIFIGSLLFVGIFFMNIIMLQTFFAVLLDHVPFQRALSSGRTHVMTNLPYYLFFYILLYLYFALFIWKAVIAYLYLGLTVGVFCTIALSIFTGFLLRRKFTPALVYESTIDINKKTNNIFRILIFFGFINYILVAILMVKEYQPLLTFVQQQQNNFLASQVLKQFTNTSYGYTIDYPQHWNVYQWNKNSVTFYNNYTGTITGGTWMTISVSQFKGSAFNDFYNANPGIVPNYSSPKTLMTKVSNMVIQGYPAVNYTYIKSGLPYTQYETHYLIHKGGNVYNIAFLSVTNDVSSYNSDLFQKIVNSFSFDK